MSNVFRDADNLRAWIGEEVGVSEWLQITQDEVNRFADVTGDLQWIHVDVERARDSAWEGTIAHGLFTLSLGPRFCYELIRIEGFEFGLNYGFERVRFPAPFRVGTWIRMRATIVSVDDVPGGVQLVVRETFEAEGQAKPVCVADAVSRWLQ